MIFKFWAYKINLKMNNLGSIWDTIKWMKTHFGLSRRRREGNHTENTIDEALSEHPGSEKWKSLK